MQGHGPPSHAQTHAHAHTHTADQVDNVVQRALEPEVTAAPLAGEEDDENTDAISMLASASV